MKRTHYIGLTWLVALLAFPCRGAAQQPFDVLITGGRVIDGSGNPWFYSDVGVRNGRIVAMGRLTGAAAIRTIDARGKVVVPGFIDIHSHADGPDGDRGGLRAQDPQRRAALNLVSQGITTVVVNQDGGSPTSIAQQRDQLEEQGFGPNVVLMVGHNSIRRAALGDDFRRLAAPAEVQTMRDAVRRGMEAGAYGLTAGLEYVPGRWSDTDEVIALVNEVKRFGGVYIVHERASGSDPMWYVPSRDEPGPPTMLDNIIEVIKVAEETGVPTVATHIKIRGADYWGSGGAIIQLVERARARGVEVWVDQYPYNTTGSDGNTVLIPDWALGRDRWQASPEPDEPEARKPDFAAALSPILDDAEAARDLRKDIAREITRRGDPENIVVFEYPDTTYVGKTLAELAAARAVSPVEMGIIMQLEGFPDRPGGARLRGFSLSEIDLEALAAQPWTITATDAGVALPGDGFVHARFYGTFPRKIREYAIERRVLSVEDAVRSATSLPAQFMGLSDRGMVREGFYADIAILDLSKLRDRATFFEPHQYAEGVEYVMIGGQFVVDETRLTAALPGVVITTGGRAVRR